MIKRQEIISRTIKLSQNQIGIELWASSNEQIFTENQITKTLFPPLQSVEAVKAIFGVRTAKEMTGEAPSRSPI